MTHHVILGAGPAGVIAAETIRKHAPHDTITLIGDEPEPCYSRMAIPYLLMGDIDERGTYLRKSPTHFKDLDINVVVAIVNAVQAATKTIVLTNGESIRFDTLLVATGSHPVHPPIPGIDSAGVHTCWTLADARAIMALAKPGARVLQLGAGFIGCIIMEALSSRGVTLSVVEMGDRMVPRMMGPTAGGMIRDWVDAKGVEVFTGTRVESIEAGTPLNVRLSNGRVMQADLVISAAGVRPAIGFMKDSGVTCLLGVLTDEHLQTNVPGIFAAGDCAEAFDKVAGKAVVSAIQPNAAEQARVAALNMVAFARGQALRAELKGVTQINVLDTLGLISTSFGDWQGVVGGEHVELTDLAQGRHLSLQFKDDVLIGCNSVGWTEHVGVMRGLVEGQVKLGDWKDTLMNDPTQLMQAYLASAQAQGSWSGAQDERRR
ncbi:MAG: FAD-dependent oxidoreductase [Gammaproteobacteria bacterium]|uniref:NAD(P)/FAD-dependent oxidoreductase n=1 Tax=Rhodoferax sp. TaxID=50421 RepID=UPI0017D5EF22|nr:FAD-dependent oxidoreductase [Rhodoferax sp.]MBU3899837.1 FAD-dependent oxidoreductase [Gammaproteobacteria bacterium]MBA3057949.1 NAD(P)/FAD-dependent oxidoreductase [Rhodoferax sp.]MBU3996020.1 FAD-dependent oxidoreductase [Gammaproteobacteria bacterium]MBU4019102.1 FAD-dependent oxidoreductase [Gammaproteobacteria bacterium]MBU4078820.1 FAD-dependent oxidoreductase [Gammaproteobacteria bacterium]